MFEGGGGRVSGYVLTADEGDAYDWRGARVVIKAASDDTSGQLGVMECTYPPGLSVPTHFHAGEDEMLYVLDGELHGYCDDERWTATPVPSCSCGGTVRTASQSSATSRHERL